MKKRVFIIHGWTTNNDGDWLPWVATKLREKDFEVTVPQMPDTNFPIIEDWMNKLTEVVGPVQPTDIFIGHSLGCQAVLRFLERQPETATVDTLIFVAGAQNLSSEAVTSAEDEEIFGPWRDTPINFEKIKKMVARTYAIFSDDDPWVLFEENAPIYEKELNAEIILEKGKKHFMKELGGVDELPIVVELVLKSSPSSS
jgi:predicted alpha/beta hydrolase family esterase